MDWIVDTHCDVLNAIEEQGRDFARRGEVGHADLPRLVESGMRLEFFSCYLPSEYKPERALSQQLAILDRFWRVVGDDRAHFRPVRTRADVLALDTDPRIGALPSLEGAEAVVSLPVLRTFFRLGVRCIALTWNERNHLADGVGVEAGGGGLTPLGVEVVREMERLGILFDVSHLHPRGFWHYLEVSSRPFIASHSNAKALCGHRRNLDDDQIRAIAARGGSIGLNFAPAFVRDGGGPEVTLEHVIDHAEHILSLVGDAHVHIGSDFDGIDSTPVGLEDVTRLGALAEGMRRRGWGEGTVRRIMGENMRRILLEVLPEETDAEST
ncbi:MAG: dipeptidase [Firmicutes bacterium]|nr:dipeptidase [Bacillota bacterium]